MIYIICFILCILAFFVGAITGIADCKRVFHIPKGVKSYAEWEEFLNGGDDSSSRVDN